MNVDTRNKRNPGIDLLRALAMFFVIIWHFIGQGGLGYIYAFVISLTNKEIDG